MSRSWKSYSDRWIEWLWGTIAESRRNFFARAPIHWADTFIYMIVYYCNTNSAINRTNTSACWHDKSILNFSKANITFLKALRRIILAQKPPEVKPIQLELNFGQSLVMCTDSITLVLHRYIEYHLKVSIIAINAESWGLPPTTLSRRFKILSYSLLSRIIGRFLAALTRSDIATSLLSRTCLASFGLLPCILLSSKWWRACECFTYMSRNIDQPHLPFAEMIEPLSSI